MPTPDARHAARAADGAAHGGLPALPETDLQGAAAPRPEAVERRLERARAELSAVSEFDAVVVNDDIELAAARLVSLTTDS